MNNYSRWAVTVGVILLAGVVALFAYNAGIDRGIERGIGRGIEQGGRIVAAPAGAPPVPYAYPYPYYRPWFGGFWLVPLFFIGIFLLARGRHRHYHACHYRGTEPVKE